VQRWVSVRRAVLALAIACAGTGVASCATAIRSGGSEAAKGATSAVTHESLKELEDPQVRARVAAVLATPEMQRALGELSAGLSRGVVAGLSSEQLSAHIDGLTTRFTQSLFTALGKGFDSPQTQEKLDRFANAVVAATMKAVGTEIPDSIAPAVQKAMTDMLRSPEFKAALGETVRTIAHDAVVGSNEALAELTEKRKRDQGGEPLAGLFAPFAGRSWLLVLLGAAIVFGVPLIWLARERAEARRFREDAERRNARADALLRAIETEKGYSPNIIALLREQILHDLHEEKKIERAARLRHSRPSHA
jgi:hypothetical protein